MERTEAIQPDILGRKGRFLDFDFFLLCISLVLFSNAIIELIGLKGF